MSNVLDLVDQTIFRRRAGGRCQTCIQCVWVYNRPVDIDGLRRFHHHLQQGRLSRRIERSPLPFGRHRWVSPSDQPELEIVATPRPREEFDAWLDEQANTPLDAEHGPGWHLAVLPFTDGGAGVSLVASTLPYRRRRAVRGRWRTRPPATTTQSAGPLPGHAGGGRPCARTPAKPCATSPLSAAPSSPQRDLSGVTAARAGSATPPPAPPAGADERVTLPTATIFVDADEWDARAHSLGGTSNTLLAALAARLAQRVGRVAADGSVTLTMPVNERTAGDTRANAITNVDITVDPAPATTDLREIRAATKQALIRSRGGARRTVDTAAPRSPGA